MRELPAHLVIAGGGYIGLEFGQMFRRFGSGGHDHRWRRGRSAGGYRRFRHHCRDADDGEASRSSKAVTERVSPHESGVEVAVDDGTKISRHASADGHRPPVQLRPAGSRSWHRTPDEQGILQDRFAVPDLGQEGVWALGDVNGHGAFTRTAYQDGQILQDPSRSVEGRVTEYAMFTDPPLGRVGMTVREARQSGRIGAEGRGSRCRA